MPISIYNPPCPHADPVNGFSPPLPRSGQGICGNCLCVARYYLLNAGDFSPPPGYPDAFAGTRPLSRDVPTYTINDQEQCHWDGAVAYPPGGLLVNLPSLPYGWSLYYQDSIAGWICRAAGQSYVGDAPPQDIAYYTLDAPGHAQTSFNCLKPTTFWMDPTNGSGPFLTSLPQSIVIQPFWP